MPLPRRYNAARVAPAQLLARNDDALFPHARGQDLASRGVRATLVHRARDGATSRSLADQARGLDMSAGGVALVTGAPPAMYCCCLCSPCSIWSAFLAYTICSCCMAAQEPASHANFLPLPLPCLQLGATTCCRARSPTLESRRWSGRRPEWTPFCKRQVPLLPRLRCRFQGMQ